MKKSVVFLILTFFCLGISAENSVAIDSLENSDRFDNQLLEPIAQTDTLRLLNDSSAFVSVPVSNENRFKPNPTRSVWMGILLPGLGQIYNRKYWKLPIVYGGFIGCIYAISWNGKYYNDFIGAYKDIKDSDPNTKSYENVLPYGVNPTSSYAISFINQRQNYYRKYRDLSIIITAALYALSVIDAFVDAQLYDFDVSPNISMKVRPTIIEPTENQTLTATAVGMKLKLNF